MKKHTVLDLKKGVDYIGVGVTFYCRDEKGNLLLHQRSNNCRDEVGNWDVGGGSIEFGENFEEAARREIKEEYCADVTNLKFVGVNNVLRKNGDQDTHWVTMVFVAQVDPKQVKIGEPDKMDDLGWFSLDNLPTPLHSMFKTHLEFIQKAGLL